MGNFTNVTIKYKDKFGAVNFVNSKTGKTISIQNNQNMRIEKGEYAIKPQDNEIIYSGDNIEINGKKSDFYIDLSYSKDRLNSMFNAEKTKIEEKIIDKYPNILNLYTIEYGALYGEGDIYGAKLVYHNSTDEFRDSLKLLLIKKDGDWEFTSNTPKQTLSQEEYSNVDKTILSEINKL